MAEKSRDQAPMPRVHVSKEARALAAERADAAAGQVLPHTDSHVAAVYEICAGCATFISPAPFAICEMPGICSVPVLPDAQHVFEQEPWTSAEATDGEGLGPSMGQRKDLAPVLKVQAASAAQAAAQAGPMSLQGYNSQGTPAFFPSACRTDDNCTRQFSLARIMTLSWHL